jgi:hypothetical protein
MRGMLVPLWGVGGVLLLLAQAIVKLTPYALEAARSGMSALEWAAYVGWTAFNAYAEGYRGFQKSFSPRVVARAMWLRDHPRPLWVILAPLFCMAMIHARRRRLIAAWILLAGIVAIVVVVRLLPQPWRGIVDSGVVVGLVWGGASMVVSFVRALRGHVPPDDSLPTAARSPP